MNLVRLYSFVLLGLAVAASGVGYWVHSRRPTPEQREAARRRRLSSMGRIIDGTVLDVREVLVEGRGTCQLLLYNYDVAGVSYECAQDISYLRETLARHADKIGLPASVKYDPHNPSNSIVVGENWCGLRNCCKREC